ncbi:MAG TPA: transketolase C-terminal domain-containing protein [Patescibacteria group bacterium]|nr:transketolase C-terminal domain-containing protein [Patescibacteria group bacterium]
MRGAIIGKIHELMKTNDKIYFLTGDLGYSVLEGIEKDFPRRFINVGVAEQNMMGIAAGLAMTGKKVFVYSIIPFVTMRCFEQIRDDICYHNLNVKILGVGSGLSYGLLGSTHFALEDVGIMRLLPRMAIVAPADPLEGSLMVKEVLARRGPVYMRIGKKDEKQIFKTPFPLHIGKGIILRKGHDVVIFSSGPILHVVLAVEEKLRRLGVSSTVVNMHTLKPLDEELVRTVSQGKKAVVTVEEHSIIGGLGGAVCETLSRAGGFCEKVLSLGTNDEFITHIGSQDYLRGKLGLSVDAIVDRIVSAVKKQPHG